MGPDQGIKGSADVLKVSCFFRSGARLFGGGCAGVRCVVGCGVEQHNYTIYNISMDPRTLSRRSLETVM